MSEEVQKDRQDWMDAEAFLAGTEDYYDEPEQTEQTKRRCPVCGCFNCLPSCPES